MQSHRSELAQKYEVRSLSLFGSVARNEANAAGDIDLIVELIYYNLACTYAEMLD
jgi:predicted nucleotidyltransferase